jgi:hypothetical protein
VVGSEFPSPSGGGVELGGLTGKTRLIVILRSAVLVRVAAQPDTRNRTPHVPHPAVRIKPNHSLYFKPPSQLDDIYGVRSDDAMLYAGHGLPEVSVDDGIWVEQLMYAECIDR